MTWASFLGLTLFSFVPSWIRKFAWHDCQTDLLGFHSSSSFFLWASMAYLLLSLIMPVGLLADISCHAGPLGFIPFLLFSLSFYGPIVSILLCFYLFFFIFACYWGILLLGLFYQKRVSTNLKENSTIKIKVLYFEHIHGPNY